MASPRPPGDPPPIQPLCGRQVLLAAAGGLVVGLLLGWFLSRIVANTPNTLDPVELRWLRRLIGAAGALSGAAIEAMRQLQAASGDPAYHQRRPGFARRSGGRRLR